MALVPTSGQGRTLPPTHARFTCIKGAERSTERLHSSGKLHVSDYPRSAVMLKRECPLHARCLHGVLHNAYNVVAHDMPICALTGGGRILGPEQLLHDLFLLSPAKTLTPTFKKGNKKRE